MRPVLLPLPGNEAMAAALALQIGADVGLVEFRHFPDRETFVRVLADVARREVGIVGTLPHPDEKFLPLAFLAATVRDLGAARVGLVAPYLPYMRQDRRFHDGEGITSNYFAKLLSHAVSWLVTVDPHLHRHKSLAGLFAIPAYVAHAAPAIAAHVKAHYPNAVLIGPDGESGQWVEAVARDANVPFLVLRKERAGDRDVRLIQPDLAAVRGRTPLIVDDIVSTGRTMIAVTRQLREGGYDAPVCVGVHALLDEEAERALHAAGIARLVSCNTVQHPSNQIDVTPAIVRAVREALGVGGG